MNTQKKIEQLACTDNSVQRIGTLAIAHNSRDRNHLQRRQQQRGISEAMMRIALAYGKKQYRRGALVYVLNDRALKDSPYVQFTDALRGLTVVCLQGMSSVQIITTYWNYLICRRVCSYGR